MPLLSNRSQVTTMFRSAPSGEGTQLNICQDAGSLIPRVDVGREPGYRHSGPRLDLIGGGLI